MEKVWSLLAAVCAIVAVVFFWFHNFDGVFVAAVIGCVAWLLNYRLQTRRRVAANAPENNEQIDD